MYFSASVLSNEKKQINVELNVDVPPVMSRLLRGSINQSGINQYHTDDKWERIPSHPLPLMMSVTQELQVNTVDNERLWSHPHCYNQR